MPRHRLNNLLPFVLVILLAGSFSLAATPEQIDKAIADGKKFIYDSQKPDGTWEGYKKESYTEGGVTCMCVYALLSTGEKEKDPRLAKAINYVMNMDSNDTYPLSFQALALSKMTLTDKVRKTLAKVAKKLLDGGENKKSMGVYGYASRPGDGGYWDHSNSQYGTLGVWAAADVGVEIPDRYWDEVEKGWIATLDNDKSGAWAYSTVTDGPTQSMTAAGIATLFVCDDAMAYKSNGACNGNINDRHIEDALKWLEPKLSDQLNLYTFYGIERIGIASGYKYLGTYDWFKIGADAIVKKQAADGSWDEWAPPVGTSYAVLFLYRGRAPIVMNKLRYDKDPTAAEKIDGNWNERHRDAAGAAAFIGNQLETFMNWQVVTLANDPDEFHDSPILYIAGNEPLNFSAEQEAKLKKFVEAGGMILGNADCATPAFADSFKKLCVKLFDGQYEFRALPPDHPIYTHQQFQGNKWKTKVDLLGMSNGVRELALLTPTSDPSVAWHKKQFKTKSDLCELIADVYLYSVDRQSIAQKGVTYIVKPDASITTTATIKLARLQYTGNWNPEPGSFRRLAAIIHNENKIDLKVDTVKLGASQLSDYAIAHLTGTTPFTLDETARAELKKFVTAGGTLIIDAAGGSKQFADAAEKELTAIFGDDARQLESPAGLSSPIFNRLAGSDIHYRSFAKQAGRNGPAIRVIFANKRAGVIFSREDISAGLVGENVDGIYGYTPETSVKLMASFIQSTVLKPH